MWWRFGPAWRERQHGLLTRLREADADIVALQECWGTGQRSQAHEFADQLGLHAAFVAPGLPPAPNPPESADQAGVDIGIGLLSRWPINLLRPVEMPARHRTPAPVAMAATVAHPAGVASCHRRLPRVGAGVQRRPPRPGRPSRRPRHRPRHRRTAAGDRLRRPERRPEQPGAAPTTRHSYGHLDGRRWRG
ncbi:MAG: hypothetical protein M3Q27_18145 [Actinomycetota bacterium]|nr:hypothetical protein [Actinomycetota bacterium]